MKKLTLNSPEVRLIFDSVAHPWMIDEWQRITHDLKIKHCCSASHSRSFIVLSLFQRASFSTLAGKRKSHTGQTEKSGASKGVTWRTCVTCPMVWQTRSSMKRAPDANGNSRFDSWYLDADTTTCCSCLAGLREESEEPPLDCVLSHGMEWGIIGIVWIPHVQKNPLEINEHCGWGNEIPWNSDNFVVSDDFLRLALNKGVKKVSIFLFWSMRIRSKDGGDMW